MNTVQKLLVPVDFSEHSANGLKYAASLAQETEAELIVLHVFDEPPRRESFESWPVAPYVPPRIPFDTWFREKSLDLYNFIQKVIGSPDHLRIRRRVKIGNPVKEIIQIAKEESIDLIVLAAQKSLFSYLIASGTFLKLAWRSPCSVLLTPAVSKEWPEPVAQLIPGPD